MSVYQSVVVHADTHKFVTIETDERLEHAGGTVETEGAETMPRRMVRNGVGGHCQMAEEVLRVLGGIRRIM